MDSYETLLEEGMKNLPDDMIIKERFEVPKVKGHIQGTKTVVTNFKAFLDLFRRDQDHFLKFLLRELATSAKFDGPRLMFNRKLSSS